MINLSVKDHSIYLFLKRATESHCFIFSGMEFQIFDPEYDKEFLNFSMLAFGTYKRLSEADLNASWCISVVCWNNPCKYSGARL